MASEPEIIVPFPAPRATLGIVRQVRSTLIASSLRSIKLRKHFDAYEANLDPAHKTAVLESVAGTWLPTEVAIAHYEACDKLGLSSAEQVEIGTEVADKVHGTLLGAMVRMASGAGVSPWTAIAQ